MRGSFSRSVSWGFFVLQECKTFLEISLARLVQDDLVRLSGLQTIKKPLLSFDATIPAALQFCVGLFQEQYADQDPEGKDDGADKVGQQKRESVKDGSSSEQCGEGFTRLGQGPAKCRT